MTVKPSHAIVISSLIFAALMIMTALVIQEDNLQNAVNLFLLAGWYVPFAYFTQMKSKTSD